MAIVIDNNKVYNKGWQMYLIKKFTPILALTLLVAGCSGQKTDEEYLTLAKSSLEQGEVNAAIINLKNLLSINPQSAEGRYLLGKHYLNQGLWTSAGKELELSYKEDFDVSLVIPLLAKAYYHLGDVKGLEELVIDVDSLPEETQTILKTFIAMTYIKEADFEQGIIYLYDVVEVNYESKYTQLSQAWKYGMDKEYSKAIEVVDNVLAESPGFVEAIEYKAYLHFKEQDMALAAEYFGKYIAIHPQAHELRMMYALGLVYSEQYKEAEQQVDLLLKGMPNNPKLNQIKAQTRFAVNDYEQAKQYAEIATRSDSSLILAKIIAGISAYQLNQLEVAYSHLNSVNSYLSYQHPAKKLLNAIKFQLGYADDAFTELLESSNANVDIDTLSISANELFRLGKVDEANSLLAKAAEKEPKNADVLYQQGLLKLFSKDSSATDFFEKAIEKNPELESATSMLLLERLKENDFDKAFEIANKVAEDNPELAFSYKGIIYVRKGELDNAKNEFKQALKINKNNAGVYFKLGQVFELEEDLASAIVQYQQAINVNIKFPLAVSALLRISKEATYKQAIQNYFEQIVAKNNDEIVSHTYLTLFHVVQNDFENAVSVLNKKLELLPNNLSLLMLKGKIQAHNKNYEGALVSFNSALKENAFNPIAFISKASVLALKGNFNEAIEAQKSAIDLMPNVTDYRVGLANLHIENNDLYAAKTVLKNIKLLDEKNVYVDRLIGKVALLNNDFSQAYDVLSEVVKTVNTEEVILELASSLQGLKRSAEALVVIERFKSENEAITSLDLLLKHAELLEKSQPEKALIIYNTILSKTDRHFAMLNNIAMINLQQGKYAQAVSFAKEALDKAPKYSAIQNTYGLTLLAVNEPKNAEIYLKQAYMADKNNVNYKVHLAEALLANNKVEETKVLISSIDEKALNDFTAVKYNELLKALNE